MSRQPRPRNPRVQRLRRAVAVFFCLVFLASIWPVYPIFSRIRPLVLGLPFSLAYLVILLVAAFLVLLGLYLWEERHGELE